MNWHNASKNEPCPVCHKPDWCNLSNDGAVAICHRVESPKPARGGGWIHRLRDECRPSPSPSSSPAPCVLSYARIHAGYDADPARIAGLAAQLGVGAGVLRAMDVRFNAVDRCWSFPMRDAEGHVVGLRFREFCGSRKWSARGSRDGLFYGVDPQPDRPPRHLVVVEGASDAAALMSLYAAPGAIPPPTPTSDADATVSDAPLVVGRSSCQTGAAHLRALVGRLRPRAVTLVADNDAPGIRGADSLAGQLRQGGGPSCRTPVRILVVPHPHKDVRAWYRAGALTPKLFADLVSAQRWC